MCKLKKVFVLTMSLFLFSAVYGCGLSYTVKDPTPSALAYTESAPVDVDLKVADGRTAEDKPISVGRISVALKNMDNEMSFLAGNLITELASRGIALQASDAEDSDLMLLVKKYRIRNHRSTGWSPFQTATTFSADFTGNGETKKIAFYFRIGKVPIWSMKEVEEPCYNLPVSLMIKEVATKINRLYFGLVMPTEKVDALVQEIEGSEDNYLFLKVMELGYTNNPAAVGPLCSLVDHDDDYVKVAAICALGMLGAVDQFEFLKQIYNDRDKDEKLMALKSIGDLGTTDAIEFVQSVKNSPEYEHHRIKEVVDLYLGG